MTPDMAMDRYEAENARLVQPADLVSDFVPTLAHVKGAIAKLKNNKAAGPNGLPAVVYRAASSSTSRLVHPLLCKVAMMGVEPFALELFVFATDR